MHRIDTSTATADHKFTEGNPTTGIPATVVSADWLNGMQEELCNVILNAGLTLQKSQTDQLWKALQNLLAPAGSTTESGTVRLATAEETIEGTSDKIAVTPAGLSAKVATSTAKGLLQLATNAAAVAGQNESDAITPASLLAKLNDMFSSGANWLRLGPWLVVVGTGSFGGGSKTSVATVDFPHAFAECYHVSATPTRAAITDGGFNAVVANTDRSATSATLQIDVNEADNDFTINVTVPFTYFAIGSWPT